MAHTAFKGDICFYDEATPTISTPAGGGHLPYVGRVGGGGFSDNRICSDVAPTLMSCTKGDDGHQSGISHRNPIVVHKTSGQTVTVKYDETGCLQAGGANVRDKVPNVLVAETAYTKSNRRDSRVKLADATSNLDSGHSCAVAVPLPDSAMSLDQDGYLRLTGARPRDENGKPQLLPIGYRRFRRLLPVECERLQGWPDYHTALGLYRSADVPKSRRNGQDFVLQPVSDTQRYRMTGNGVTADVVREVVLKMIGAGCFG
ncbi:MAG: DNA cytosine methyltransferase [Dehalococcoidales bacterium]|nr:DNA cytosine methyltransferase [Dehalococcoidales bacterium]